MSLQVNLNLQVPIGLFGRRTLRPLVPSLSPSPVLTSSDPSSSLLPQQVLPSFSSLLTQWVPSHARVLSQRSTHRKKNESIKHLDDFSAELAAASLRYLARNNLINFNVTSSLTPYDLIPVKARARRNLPWMVSHSSNWSFNANKNPIFSTPSGLVNRSKLFSSCQLNHLCLSSRTMKTRSRTAVGLGSEPSRLSAAEDALQHLDSKAPKTETPNAGTSDSQKELLKFLSEVTTDDVQKLKTAFAEGFIQGQKKPPESIWGKAFRYVRDFILIASTVILIFLAVALWSADISISNGTNGKGGRLKLFKSLQEVLPEDIEVRFDDVKGVDEAKQELEDVVDFLKSPEKYSALGGKLPKGVLLVGPPGTGKTLLARAVAGEAGVAFLHTSGSEFDEIFVGQGARRIRELFDRAKSRAPCVIFIDEIDSVGQTRTSSAVHPYANQTINQLLTEMDGFQKNEGVVVIGATNRQDNLDAALLRPGRFDLRVNVSPPDLEGRIELFDLYLSKVVVGSGVDSHTLARKTVNFTGAHIENMVNQAAIKAAGDGAPWVTMDHLWYAYDKIVMGPEKHRLASEEDSRLTAFHEGGHTLVSIFTKDSTPVHKVTIVSRGSSLGHTAFIPEKDLLHLTKSQILARLDTALGGRAAEELIFGSEKVTSGASSDLKEATELATNMVAQFGMSERFGLPIALEDISPEKKALIEDEVKRLLNESYERAKAVLKSHQTELKLLAEALLKYETLDDSDIKLVIEGKEPKAAQRISRKSSSRGMDKVLPPGLTGGPKTPLEI